MSDAHEYAVTKVLAKADKWLDCRQDTQANSKSPKEERVRSLGRFQAASLDLACSVESLRKAKKVES